ncbi:hypothetical protein AB1Y20_002309 [Prymnesium parvum]|uniref:Uncharacterized protein n=1 Tax=Prymnesium parvum TaxID=97485 RepID=A0AB34J865_PRYPA
MSTCPTPWQPRGSTPFSSMSVALVTLSNTRSHGHRARKRRARTSATTSSLRRPCTPMPLSVASALRSAPSTSADSERSQHTKPYRSSAAAPGRRAAPGGSGSPDVPKKR